jgi:hypothetical protein
MTHYTQLGASNTNFLPFWVKAALLASLLLQSAGLMLSGTYGAFQVSASIGGNFVETGVWSNAPTLATDGNVVLNEFLPNSGDDNADMPNGEWVELYNNESFDVDLTDWYVTDSSGGAGNTIELTALTATTNIAPGTTTISAGGFLVVYMNKQIFNNPGDTVRLFNSSDTLKDSYEYGDDICQSNDPTPGGANEDDVVGPCNESSVPVGKSFARFIDGIGLWVDPEPTPGDQNRFSRQDLINSGFSEEMVTGMIALLASRGEYLLGEEPTGEPEAVVEVATSTEALPEETASSTVPAEETSTSTTPSVEQESGQGVAGEGTSTPSDGEPVGGDEVPSGEVGDGDTDSDSPVKKDEDEQPIVGGGDDDSTPVEEPLDDTPAESVGDTDTDLEEPIDDPEPDPEPPSAPEPPSSPDPVSDSE